MSSFRLMRACQRLASINYITSLSKVCQRNLSVTSRVMSVHTNLIVRDGVGVVKIDSPGKVNVLNTAVMDEMKEIIDKVQNDSSIRSVVLISSKPDNFIAGADINMLVACKTAAEVENLSKDGQIILNKIENSEKPVVAAIMGSCLGGGLEVALACHYRIAVKEKSTLGFPEVMLGLLPGAGGTQRAPKLIGLLNALDIALTGKNIRADKAKKMGLVDELVNPLGPGSAGPVENTLNFLEEVAVKQAKSLADGNLNVKRGPKTMFDKVFNMALKYDFVKDYVFNNAKAKVMKQTKGVYPAPLRILKVIRTGIDEPGSAGYDAEAKGFGELAMTKESKGLISLFQGQTECKKNRFGTPEKKVKTIGVLGAGLMGAGIAQVSIDKGYHTLLKDMNNAGLGRGIGQVQNAVATSVKKKKYSSAVGEKYLSNLEGTLSYQHFNKADMVIEAVFEDLNLKHNVIKEVEKHIPPHCIFASNTSALPIGDIAKGSSRPEKVIGMHYFSPVDKMQLLEIITHDKTSKDTVASAVDVGLKQGKVVIVVKDGPGFYTTRLVGAMCNQVLQMIVEGVEFKKLDKLTQGYGFPIGLVTLIDEVGLDVGMKVYKTLSESFGDRLKDIGDNKSVQEIASLGFFGRKTGKGFYIYNKELKDRPENAEIKSILSKHKLQPKVELTDENIQLRPVVKFVNEAAMCLQEGIIANPLEGDIGAVFGVGFPPFTGGPFHFIDSYGADKLVAKMKQFEEGYGVLFTPCQLLLDYAKDPSKKFFN